MYAWTFRWSGDLREMLARLLPGVKRVDRSDWLSRIDDSKHDSAVRDIQNMPDNGHLYAAHVIHELWRETNGDAIIVTDVGQHQMWEAQYYHHEKPRTLITSGGLGTMGFALPAAIGAKVCQSQGRGLGRRRRRRVSDDYGGACHHRAGKARDQNRHRE